MNAARRTKEAILQCYTVLLHFLRGIWLICSHLPYFFRQTPDEIAANTRKAAEERDDWIYVTVETSTGQIKERYMNGSPTPPPGHVLVKLYRGLDCLWQDSAVMSVVKLEDDGGLDLRQLRLQWHLENCHPVDSIRATIFQTTVPDRLSPLAVLNLTENQYWLRVVEIPSQRVQDMRTRRLQCIAAYTQLVHLLSQFPALLSHLSHHFGRAITLLQDIRDFPADLQEAIRDARCRVRRSTQLHTGKGDTKECHYHRLCRCHANNRQQNEKIMPDML